MQKLSIFALVLAASLCITEAASLSKPAKNKELRTYIVIASNLPNEDKKDLSDPFLVVRVSGNQIYRSDTAENTLNPVFSPTLPLNYAAGTTYEFEVRDEDSLNPDDTLGTVRITGSNLAGAHTLSSGAKITIAQI